MTSGYEYLVKKLRASAAADRLIATSCGGVGHRAHRNKRRWHAWSGSDAQQLGSYS